MPNPNPRIFLLLSLLVVAVFSASALRSGLGGYSPVKNLNDGDLKEIAKFAVGAYNEQNGVHLQFVKIVKAESQVVSGTNYRLVIAVKDSGAQRKYEAVVYDVPWRHTRSLTSFKPL